jgi:hypothetical protein
MEHPSGSNKRVQEGQPLRDGNLFEWRAQVARYERSVWFPLAVNGSLEDWLLLPHPLSLGRAD